MTKRLLLLAAVSLLLAAAPLYADDAEDAAVETVLQLSGHNQTIIERDVEDPAHPVVWVNLSACGVTDADLKKLAGLKELRVLYLAGTNVTDAGLKELAALKKLLHLDLSFTKVTGAGFKELAALKTLKVLTLQDCDVTDAGLKDLVPLEEPQPSGSTFVAFVRRIMGWPNGLHYLDLSNCLLVTDAGLKHLADLKGLEVLYLRGTQVTDAGLKELAPLKALRTLKLGGCHGVTDAGLKELARLKGLQKLDLSYTKVTSAGLNDLAALEGLKELHLDGLDVGAGVDKLKKALPDCKILFQ